MRWRRRIDPERLVFLDEAGANLAMGRSHVWVKRGTECVEPRPMNWGNNLTLIGAIRQRGWVTLGTQWTAVTAQSFVTWVRRHLAPGLRPGDIVVLDNLRAHKDPRVRHTIVSGGARCALSAAVLVCFNPIEAAWGLVKKRIRTFAPRTAHALRASRGRPVTSSPRITVVSGLLMPGTPTQVLSGVSSLQQWFCEYQHLPNGPDCCQLLPRESIVGRVASLPSRGGDARHTRWDADPAGIQPSGQQP
jgi:transposase